MCEVEETLQRIERHPGVTGLIVFNRQGAIIRTNVDVPTAQQFAAGYQKLLDMAHHAVRDLDPQNELKFMRVRTHGHEILLAPEQEYTLVVIHTPPKTPDAAAGLTAM